MEDKKGWTVGHTSRRYEAGGRGPGTISTGKGDHGGVSYGQYQLSSSAKTVDEYLAWSVYGKHFVGLEINSPAFKQKWRDLAASESGFGDDQHEFIRTHHYRPQLRALIRSGLDVSSRGGAVHDAVWSTAVQYGGLTQSIFKNGLVEKFGRDFNLSSISDEQLVEAVQDYKASHLEEQFASSKKNWPGLRNRIRDEKAELMEFARTGIPVPFDTDRIAGSRTPVMKLGDQGQHVKDLQANLREMGYLGSNGQRLEPDGHFGRNTRDAVLTFQRSLSLVADGEVGARTLAALKSQSEAAHGHDIALRREGRMIEQAHLSFLQEHQHRAAVETYNVAPSHRIPSLDVALSQERSHEDLGYNGVDLRTPAPHGLDMEATTRLQEDLKKLGVTDYRNEPLAVHGFYDSYTKAAVARFQQQEGFEVNGVADEATRRAIRGRAFIADLRMAQEAQRSWAPPAQNVAEEMDSDTRSVDRQPTVRPPYADPQGTTRVNAPSPLGELTTQAQSAPNLSDPRHPVSVHHGLYSELGRRVPEASEERLLQFTAACHTNRITGDNLSSCHLNEQNMTMGFLGSGPLATPVTVDLTKPPPQPEQAVAQIAQYDHQQAQIRSEYLAQQMQQQMSRSGPSR